MTFLREAKPLFDSLLVVLHLPLLREGGHGDGLLNNLDYSNMMRCANLISGNSNQPLVQ